MSRTLLQFARYWLPPIALMGLIFFLSAQPKADMPDWGTMDTFLKKMAHVAVYGLLYLLLLRAFRGEWPARTAGGRGVYLPVFIAILYGASDEWHQSFVPGRRGNPAGRPHRCPRDLPRVLCGATATPMVPEGAAERPLMRVRVDTLTRHCG